MVVAYLARVDDVPEDLPHEGCVLELVARGADGHVEAVQRGPVVDRNPVGRDVVDAGQAGGPVGDGQAGKPPGLAPNLGLEAVDRGVRRDSVRVVGPFERIAVGLDSADQQRVADLWAGVVAEVQVGDHDPTVFKGESGRCRNHVHFLAHRAVAGHAVVRSGEHPCQLVQAGTPRTGGVDDHRGVDLPAVGRHDADRVAARVAGATVGVSNLHDLGAQLDLGAEPSCGVHEVGRRQLRIVDESRIEDPDGVEPTGGLVAEPWIVGSPRWIEPSGVQCRELFRQLVLIEDLPGHTDLR